LYGKPPGPIDQKIKKKIIGDEEPITRRPADLLEPALENIPEDVKSLIESEEDKITYALFPKQAVDFFKRRKMKHEEAKTGISPERLAELEDVAAVSVAVAAYAASTSQAKALTQVRPKGHTSAWVLAGRQALSERGA
jgi:pyruvate/oxaloacetate carboxyltransferase